MKKSSLALLLTARPNGEASFTLRGEIEPSKKFGSPLPYYGRSSYKKEKRSSRSDRGVASFGILQRVSEKSSWLYTVPVQESAVSGSLALDQE